MQNERVIRAVAFVVFFSIGATVLAATLLCDDFRTLFYLKGMETQSQVNLNKIKSLITDYDTVLGQIDGNPKELARLAPATLGIEINEPNTVYPRAAADKLAIARRALAEEPNSTETNQGVPPWLCLSCQWPRRHMLFISGAILVLISFVFFGPVKDPSHTMEVKSNPPPPPVNTNEKSVPQPEQPASSEPPANQNPS
jgi:hypothetical protein